MDSMNINLLRTRSTLSQEELIFLQKLRFFSIAVISAVFIVGLFVGIAYIAGGMQYDRLERKRLALSRLINIQAKKQILLLSLQERIPIIEKVFDSQYSWDKVIDNIIEIISPPFLKRFSIEEDSTVHIMAHVNSLEELESIVVRTVKQAEEKKIRSPVINSLVVEKDGKIEARFTFTPML
jgi:hypothetical protein